MITAICAALAALLVVPSAGAEGEYSVSSGAGQYFALRHSPPGRDPYEEIVGSSIAMNRAKKQALDGGYPLEIKGPFGGVREARIFIVKEWDPDYGKPRKPIYVHPSPEPGGGKVEGKDAP